MPLNNDEVKRLRSAMPGETAKLSDDQIAAGAVDTLIQQFQTINQQNASTTQLRTDLTARDTEIAALKGKLPQAVDPALAAGHIDLACKRIEHLSSTGHCLPAQAAAITKALSPDGKPDAAAYQGGRVVVPLDAVESALNLNTPVQMGSKTPVQKLDPNVPGKDDKAETGAKTVQQAANAAADRVIDRRFRKPLAATAAAVGQQQ